MVDFVENMRRKGKAEEDLYFAELDRKLIEALHEKQARQFESSDAPIASKDHSDTPSQMK
ncbi:hypothetical protein [Photobacterium chitinilyticum]|nr:hypothetical protein [Photobacterium chitinilyticum]